MKDWEKMIKAETVEELREMKLWLFKENMRIEKEKEELEEMKDKFTKEKTVFHKEMSTLSTRSVYEQKRIREENLFFEKKMIILQDGFRRLEEDRKNFERTKKIEKETSRSVQAHPAKNIIGVLFRNVNNMLTLRKRYRDLVKIYHPDNLCGDEELVQLINKEFSRRKEEL